MAFAADTDVEAALGRSLTAAEDSQVAGLLESASDRVVGYLRYIPDPVPAPVARVVADMVAAVFSKPSPTVADYDAGGYTTAREAAGVRIGNDSSTTTGPWLTKQMQARLKVYRNWAYTIVPGS